MGRSEQQWIKRYQGGSASLVCVLGFTETGLVPGISAAGATPADRRYTALADAEFLYHGASYHPHYPLPPLQAGLSPAVITRALWEQFVWPLYLFNAGLPQTPTVPTIDLKGQPAQCLSTGKAMSWTTAAHLFQAGLTWGERLISGEVSLQVSDPVRADPSWSEDCQSSGKTLNPADAQSSDKTLNVADAQSSDKTLNAADTRSSDKNFNAADFQSWGKALNAADSQSSDKTLNAGDFQSSGKALNAAPSYLILGECVVGGTTTALGVLLGLGIAAANRVNSSHPICNHAQKLALVNQGLARFTSNSPITRSDPLAVAAALGDPMQIVVAGMTLAASRRGGVLLAGGTQMLAVYGLSVALAQTHQVAWNPEAVAVGTTRWVAEDPSGDTSGLVRAIGQHFGADFTPPLLVTPLNFSRSRHLPLRDYEKGYVKEGVAAGGTAIAAHVSRGWQPQELLSVIDEFVDRLRSPEFP